MVTFVVSLFLPYTVDFHEFDDDIDGALRKSASSRSTSTLNLEALGKRHEARSLLEEVADTSAQSAEATPPQRPTLMQRLSQVKVDVTDPPPSDKPESESWVQTDSSGGDRIFPELMDEPNHRMNNAVNTGFLSTSTYNQASVYRTVSPSHSRKSSLAFVLPESQQAKPEIRPEDIFKGFDDSLWTITNSVLSNGGLVNAVRKSIRGQEADTMWIGTLEGEGTDRISLSRKEDIADKFAHKHNALVLYTSDEDREGHYEHFCKVILWPVLHYHMPNNLKGKAYQDVSWRFYYNVNQNFADKIVDNYKQGDVVWIQDYHLMLVPKMIRDRLPDAEIGFFLHTAFPSSELFRCVSTRRELLEGMLGAALIGFQTGEYVRHFLQTCSRVLLAETSETGVYFGDRFIRVITQPIGVVCDSLDLEREKEESGFAAYVEEIEMLYEDKILIVARDKLDTVRGMRQKLLAYEQYLQKNPTMRQKIVLLQIATSTTELVEYHTSVHDIIQRINDTYATLEHLPVEFLSQDMPHSSYVAVLSAADILLITSLREGMGLTAQEFVHCQDGRVGTKKHGVVILSEFTGTSALFCGHDLTCNPWDTGGTAELIERAVNMSAEEKSQRWHKLRDIVQRNSGDRWWSTLQLRLHEIHQQGTKRSRQHTPRLDVGELARDYAAASKRLVLLANEETISTTPTKPELRRKICDILDLLSDDPANTVYVTSSLTPPEVEDLYGFNPALGLIAENGSFTHTPHSLLGEWIEAESGPRVRTWKSEVKPFLQDYLGRIEGATLVEHWTSLTIDYSAAIHLQAAEMIIGELLAHVNDACRGLRIHAVPSSTRRVIIESLGKDKASAAAGVVATAGSPFPDFILVVGATKADEPLFRWANGLTESGTVRWTVSLGRGMTDAGTTLSGGPAALSHALGRLATLSAERRASGEDSQEVEAGAGDNSSSRSESEGEGEELTLVVDRA